PSRIIFSASRREHSPARAITLAMRSPFGASLRSTSSAPVLGDHFGVLVLAKLFGSRMTDVEAIALALAEAEAAAKRGEVPVGAVLLSADGTLLAADGTASSSGAIRLPMPKRWCCARARPSSTM